MVVDLTDPEACIRLVTSMSAFSVLLWTLEHFSRGCAFWGAEKRGRAIAKGGGNIKGGGVVAKSGGAINESDERFPGGVDLLAGSLGRFLEPPAAQVVLGVRAAAALLLIASPWLEGGQLVGIGAVYVTNLLLLNRVPVNRGSDGMMQIVFGALFLRQLAGDSPIVTEACLWFIALQVCLSYGSCGAAKLAVPAWRKGHAAFIVANHQLFGSRAVARFLYERPRLTKLLTWGTMIMECAFPLVLVLGYPICWVFLGWGMAFHGINATVLGLNSFLWTYVATYPAIIYCVLRLHALLYG